MTTCEEELLAGICNECSAEMKPWTADEIKAAKEDVGMGDDDDFCSCCDECAKKYMDGYEEQKPWLTDFFAEVGIPFQLVDVQKCE